MAKSPSAEKAAAPKKAVAPKKAESPKKVEAPAKLPANVIRVVAVIRPMHAPDDGVLIPEGGLKGVLIKKSSWATSQLERGLLRIVE